MTEPNTVSMDREMPEAKADPPVTVPFAAALSSVATARTLWVPAVNNHGGFGRWAFIEIDDPWNAGNLVRAFVQQHSLATEAV